MWKIGSRPPCWECDLSGWSAVLLSGSSALLEFRDEAEVVRAPWWQNRSIPEPADRQGMHVFCFGRALDERRRGAGVAVSA
jgi:hypothetical protein